MNFSSFIPKMFADEKADEAAALAQLERKRGERQYREHLAMRLAALSDQVDQAERNFKNSCASIDSVTKVNMSDYALLLSRGAMTVEGVSRRFAEAEAMAKYSDALKSEMRKLVVGSAGKALADFRREHRKVLAKLPPLERSEIPHFVPSQLPVDHYLKGHSEAVQIATGIFKAPQQ